MKRADVTWIANTGAVSVSHGFTGGDLRSEADGGSGNERLVVVGPVHGGALDPLHAPALAAASDHLAHGVASAGGCSVVVLCDRSAAHLVAAGQRWSRLGVTSAWVPRPEIEVSADGWPTAFADAHAALRYEVSAWADLLADEMDAWAARRGRRERRVLGSSALRDAEAILAEVAPASTSESLEGLCRQAFGAEVAVLAAESGAKIQIGSLTVEVVTPDAALDRGDDDARWTMPGSVVEALRRRPFDRTAQDAEEEPLFDSRFMISLDDAGPLEGYVTSHRRRLDRRFVAQGVSLRMASDALRRSADSASVAVVVEGVDSVDVIATGTSAADIDARLTLPSSSREREVHVMRRRPLQTSPGVTPDGAHDTDPPVRPDQPPGRR